MACLGRVHCIHSEHPHVVHTALVNMGLQPLGIAPVPFSPSQLPQQQIPSETTLRLVAGSWIKSNDHGNGFLTIRVISSFHALEDSSCDDPLPFTICDGTLCPFCAPGRPVFTCSSWMDCESARICAILDRRRKLEEEEDFVSSSCDLSAFQFPVNFVLCTPCMNTLRLPSLDVKINSNSMRMQRALNLSSLLRKMSSKTETQQS